MSNAPEVLKVLDIAPPDQPVSSAEIPMRTVHLADEVDHHTTGEVAQDENWDLQPEEDWETWPGDTWDAPAEPSGSRVSLRPGLL